VQTGIVTLSEVFTVLASVTNGNHKTPNPHSFTKAVRSNPYGRTVEFTNGRPDLYSEAYGISVQGLAAIETWTDYTNAAYNKALGRYYDKLRGDLDLSISLFESGQTVKMLKAVTKFTSYVKNTFNPKNIGNKWLEYQYGWRPLVNDIFQAADKLVAKPTSPYRIIDVRASEAWRADKTTDNLPPGTYRGYDLYRDEWDANYRCRLVGFYGFTDSALLKLAGWSSLNPISIAWELLPYSFVADWFIDIGGYLRATESALLYSQAFKGGVQIQGYRKHARRTNTADYTYKQGNNPLSTITTTGIKRQQSDSWLTGKTRTVLTSSPSPRLPSFKADLGSSRLLSAAALLSQFVGKR